jgi:hypothetical protein
MTEILKKYSTIGCCGIDCGLCPRFHTKGDSVCPGCGGPNFKEKHPSCGFLTCCVAKNGLEVCSDCKDYACRRFDSWRNGFDSFVTHRKIFENLDIVKNNGINYFTHSQKIRIDILKDFLARFDDGRSKSFFCISCALLPLDTLQEIRGFLMDVDDSMEIKTKSQRLKNILQKTAESLGIDLKLNVKKKTS